MDRKLINNNISNKVTQSIFTTALLLVTLGNVSVSTVFANDKHSEINNTKNAIAYNKSRQKHVIKSSGYDVNGYNAAGYNKYGYNVHGYDKEGVNVLGHYDSQQVKH
ncbi:hypothetical protein MNBD_GAMMA12-3000 [hydrothermal vent metagenome]|uniref:Uncharacterized protein n=1 Tax=hydrothermal vent metagenome TaxID=652676 RepID=A0A3B0YCU3_9ZZZZ